MDHRDNNRLNNNVNNLRYVNSQQNNFNRSLSSKSTSGYKGVTFDKSNQKWKAQISINKKIKHLGYFTNKEDALKARLKKSVEIQGEFINQCESIYIRRLALDQELIDLEKELDDLINN